MRNLHREGADEQVAAGGEVRDDLGQVGHAPQIRQPQYAFIIIIIIIIIIINLRLGLFEQILLTIMNNLKPL